MKANFQKEQKVLMGYSLIAKNAKDNIILITKKK
jgi:hypothetical protein